MVAMLPETSARTVVVSASATVTSYFRSTSAGRPSVRSWTGTVRPPVGWGSVLLLDRQADVDRREDHEDVRLEGRDEHLEESEDEAAGERQCAEALHRGDGLEDEVLGRREAQGQPAVAGHHVGHQPERERRGPDDEDLEELDRREQHVEERRHAGREKAVLEEAAETQLAHAGAQVGHV